MVSVFCPNRMCTLRLTLAEDRAGTSLPCPKCGQTISVPIPHRSPAPPPPRSGSVPPPSHPVPSPRSGGAPRPAPTPAYAPSKPPPVTPTPAPRPLPPPLPVPASRPSPPPPEAAGKLLRHPAVWIGVTLLLVIGTGVTVWAVTRRPDGSGLGAPAGGLGEMHQPDLAALVFDLNKIPGLTVTSIFDDKPSPMVAGILPPDRRYQFVQLVITDNAKPENKHYLIVTDCTSPERAALVRERWAGGGRAPAKEGPEGGGKPAVCSSGQFVIWGREEAIDFLRRYYRLR
jgi:hypothetical protein